MLRKIYRTSILRTVRSTLSRFLAIFAIVALGVGFLSGLLTAPADMRLSAESYYDAYQMYDMQIVSTQGLTADDLRAVQNTKNVETAVAVKDTDLVLQAPNGNTLTTRMHTLPGESSDAMPLNNLHLLEGRLPEKSGECVIVSTKTLLDSPVKIGDKLTVSPDNTETTQENSVPNFTVVGFVKTPIYFSMEKEHTNVGSGSVSLIAYTTPSSFSYDYYTAMYLTLNGSKQLDSFSPAYKNLVDEVTASLEELRPEREALRYEGIKEEASRTLQDSENEYNDKKTEAEKKLADAKKELDDGRIKLADGEKKLADAKQQITDGEQELRRQKEQFQSTIAENREKINNGYAQINSYRTQLNDGEKQLSAAWRDYETNNSQIAQLEAGKAAFIQGVANFGITLPDDSDATVIATIGSLLKNPNLPAENVASFTALQNGLSALAASGTTVESSRQALNAAKDTLDTKSAELVVQKQQLDSQQASLDSANTELENGVATAQREFAAAENKLANGRTDYDKGLNELESSKVKLEDGQKEYDKAKKEADEKLADGQQKIDDAKKKIADIEKGTWYLRDRDNNTSYASYSSNADKIANIAKVFPVFFFLIAALVALTTMTRMVDEERLQIGTMKALGYTTGQIAAKYLLYAAAASITGSAAGMTIGMQVLPRIILDAYNIMYDIPVLLTPFHVGYGLLAGTIAVACTLIATLNACWSALKESPARLMLPKAPKAGKRIFLERLTPIWKRMKFTHKVTARNLFLYKKRFVMTIVGIAGCTALLVTGFGVRDSISDIVNKQFSELQNYQMIAALENADDAETAKLQAHFKDDTRIKDTLAVMQNDSKVIPAKGRPNDSLIVEVPESTEKLNSFFNFRHRTNSKPVVFDENAVIVTEKLAERQHWSVGDTITIENKNGKRAELKITDICENYSYHYLFLSQTAYETAFGEKPEPNIMFFNLEESSVDDSAFSAELLQMDSIAGVQFISEISSSFEKSMESINFIVYVLIVSAGALAFVVLYNLTNINITEREKELATIKVLGFYDGEVSAYIYRETAMLTLIGTLFGLGFGMILHQFVIRTSEIDLVMFGRSIYGPSYLWSALLTIVFAILVNLVMYRKLKKINMVESLKAPE